MKRTIITCIFLLITIFIHAQKRAYQVSGKVVDPKTGEGIPGAYVAFQGFHVELLFGGPEYFDDLVVDSTNADGHFTLQIPASILDSFYNEHGSFYPHFRFALEIRTQREAHGINFDFNILINMYPIGNISGHDRNYINHRTLILTEKNKKWKSDTTGMVISLHKGGIVHFIMPTQDTAFMNNNFLHVFVQELDKKDGKVILQEQTNFDLTERNPGNNLLVKPYTTMTISLCKWPRGSNNMDTLTTIKNIELKCGEVMNISVPTRAK